MTDKHTREELLALKDLDASDRERSSMLNSLLPPNELPVPKSEVHF